MNGGINVDRTKRLLEAGYFPTQLPAGFTTRGLADNYVVVLADWQRHGNGEPRKPPVAKTETFSVARAGHRRRVTAITNPVGQTYLAKHISDNWGELLKHYRQSKLSASRPRIQASASRGATIPSMKLHAEFLLLRSAGFKFALRTDISRFFPTIYTHSIPWALHSKQVAKRNRTRRLLGNLLDETSRNLQDGQTIGLPIGPDTSHIIAELITAAIDKKLENELGKDIAGLRYVDDYYLFFRSRNEAENALATLIRLLQEYELQINFEKTRICETVELADDLWTHELRAFHISEKATTQNRDLHHFLEISKRTAARNADESVMLYAIKKAASKVIRRENWRTFVAHLCHVAIAYPNTLQQVERILSTYVSIGYPIDRAALGRLANSIIDEHAPLNHHSEVAWCLWMCKSLDLKLSEENVRRTSAMRSSVCSLILLDLEQSGKLPIAIDHSTWDDLRAEEHLLGDSWLLCYEAGIRNWGGFQKATVEANPYFNDLAKRDIHFYEPLAKSRRIFTFDEEAAKKAKGDNTEDWLSLLDGDDAEEYVEFDDDPNEYGSISLDEFDEVIEIDDDDEDENEGDEEDEEEDMYNYQDF